MKSALSLLLVIFSAGCGYTNKTVLPMGMKTIYVDTVKNKIPVESVFAYQPGLEIKITDAVIRLLQRDGNLRVVPKEEADVVLESNLQSLQQEGLRFTSLESVEEYRLLIYLSMKLVDGRTGDVIWTEPSFSGDTNYFVTGNRSVARGEAAERAVAQLARNVVDRIVEDW